MGDSVSNKKGIREFLKVLSNVVTWILAIFLVFISLFLCFYFYDLASSRAEGEDPKITMYSIISGSMEPNLKVYDVVINLKPKGVDSIEVGDVITFTSTSDLYSTRLITHRVIDIVEVDGHKEYVTQGDNNIIEDDSTVPFENIKGEVVFKIPQLGRVKFLLANVGGWILLVILPALFIFIGDVLKLNKLIDTKEKLDDIVQDDIDKAKEIQKIKEEKELNLRSRYNIDVKSDVKSNMSANMSIDKEEVAKELDGNNFTYSDDFLTCSTDIVTDDFVKELDDNVFEDKSDALKEKLDNIKEKLLSEDLKAKTNTIFDESDESFDNTNDFELELPIINSTHLYDENIIEEVVFDSPSIYFDDENDDSDNNLITVDDIDDDETSNIEDIDDIKVSNSLNEDIATIDIDEDNKLNDNDLTKVLDKIKLIDNEEKAEVTNTDKSEDLVVKNLPKAKKNYKNNNGKRGNYRNNNSKYKNYRGKKTGKVNKNK